MARPRRRTSPVAPWLLLTMQKWTSRHGHRVPLRQIPIDKTLHAACEGAIIMRLDWDARTRMHDESQDPIRYTIRTMRAS